MRPSNRFAAVASAGVVDTLLPIPLTNWGPKTKILDSRGG